MYQICQIKIAVSVFYSLWYRSGRKDISRYQKTLDINTSRHNIFDRSEFRLSSLTDSVSGLRSLCSVQHSPTLKTTTLPLVCIALPDFATCFSRSLQTWLLRHQVSGKLARLSRHSQNDGCGWSDAQQLLWRLL